VLHEEEYKNTVRRLMKEGYKKLGECTVIASREIDREIAKDLGLQVSGYIEVSGGILLKSKDGKVIDNTFEGILKRKKDEIRIEVGKLLGFGCY
jgi:vacuolar-type H+-ATPase subunit E/Vma4